MGSTDQPVREGRGDRPSAKIKIKWEIEPCGGGGGGGDKEM